MAGKHKPKGMELVRASVPASTYDYFRKKSEAEGVPMQALIAPVLNAVARGEIQGGYSVVPAAHGNAKKL